MNAYEGTRNLLFCQILVQVPNIPPLEAQWNPTVRRNMWMTNNGFRDFLVNLTSIQNLTSDV